MTFTLPVFDRWTFQLVLCRNAMVLMAMRGEDQLSTLLKPSDSRHRCADALLRFPHCALVAGPASDHPSMGRLGDQGCWHDPSAGPTTGSCS